VPVAFSLGCFACCVPCDPCDAACDETPDEAFAVVYQVEDDRANLTWTGDAMGPIDGPWPGFESGSSFSQTITSNNVLLPGSRFPCYFRLKLWRNVGGGEGSESLTSQRVTISCSQGKLNLGFLVLNAGESVEFTTAPENSTATYVLESTPIALDDNGGDRHAHPPTEWQISGGALCADTSVSVQASIEWSNDLIQHNLYGEFQECFDDPPDPPGGCKITCNGNETDIPVEVFLTISNVTEDNSPPSGYTATFPDIEGTFALPLLSFCRQYGDTFSVTDGVMRVGVYYGIGMLVDGYPFSAPNFTPWSERGGTQIYIAKEDYEEFLCGDVATLSGTATIQLYLLGPGGGGGVNLGSMTFDWELSS
jgi:hypothetical protein